MASFGSLIRSAREKGSWLAEYIPDDIIPAVFEVLDSKDAVRKLREVPSDKLEKYFNAADAFRRARDSISTLSSISSADSGASSTRPTQRDSLASDITSYSSSAASVRTKPEPPRPEPSTAEPSRGRPTASIAPPSPAPSRPRSRSRVANLVRKKAKGPEHKFFCPSCGVGRVREDDFAKHIKTSCEKLSFMCREHGATFRTEAELAMHFRTESHGMELGYDRCPISEKKAFGCPYCGSYQQSLEDYIKCLIKDSKVEQGHPLPSASATLRIRGLLQQQGTKVAIAYDCRKRGLPIDAWKSVEWDNATAAAFSDKLEYGCDGAQDELGRPLGVESENIGQFIEELMNRGKFELGGPVPPIKDQRNNRQPEMLFAEIRSAPSSHSQQGLRKNITPTPSQHTPSEIAPSKSKMVSSVTKDAAMQERTAAALEQSMYDSLSTIPPPLPPFRTKQTNTRMTPPEHPASYPPSLLPAAMDPSNEDTPMRSPATNHFPTTQTTESYDTIPGASDAALPRPESPTLSFRPSAFTHAFPAGHETFPGVAHGFPATPDGFIGNFFGTGDYNNPLYDGSGLMHTDQPFF